MPEPEDQQKLYYTIKEVSQMMKLKPSTLRFWEKEFDGINPRTNKKGDRYYTVKDIDRLKAIHNLLKERGYKIEGAKRILAKRNPDGPDRYELIRRLEEAKSFLRELKRQL